MSCLSDHMHMHLFISQIMFRLNYICSITHETKTKLDEKRWKNIKTYKWTDTSKELLIQPFSDENKKNEILGFELNNITENQDGVDEATGK